MNPLAIRNIDLEQIRKSRDTLFPMVVYQCYDYMDGKDMQCEIRVGYIIPTQLLWVADATDGTVRAPHALLPFDLFTSHMASFPLRTKRAQ